MTGGEGLAGITDEPVGKLGIRARVRTEVPAEKIRGNLFCCLGADKIFYDKI